MARRSALQIEALSNAGSRVRIIAPLGLPAPSFAWGPARSPKDFSENRRLLRPEYQTRKQSTMKISGTSLGPSETGADQLLSWLTGSGVTKR